MYAMHTHTYTHTHPHCHAIIPTAATINTTTIITTMAITTPTIIVVLVGWGIPGEEGTVDKIQ